MVCIIVSQKIHLRMIFYVLVTESKWKYVLFALQQSLSLDPPSCSLLLLYLPFRWPKPVTLYIWNIWTFLFGHSFTFAAATTTTTIADKCVKKQIRHGGRCTKPNSRKFQTIVCVFLVVLLLILSAGFALFSVWIVKSSSTFCLRKTDEQKIYVYCIYKQTKTKQNTPTRNLFKIM